MKVVALAGGVGGAKLADGLARSSSSPDLTVIVNTGDDFSLYGLKISPDLDTVCYTLAGIEGPETGWAEPMRLGKHLRNYRSWAVRIGSAWGIEISLPTWKGLAD